MKLPVNLPTEMLNETVDAPSCAPAVPPNVIALGYDPGDGSGWDEECAFLIVDEQALRRRLAEESQS